MSKNTASIKFRKVNVDQYDEDNFEDDAIAVADDVAAVVASKQAECNKLVNAGKKLEALQAALQTPPYAASADVKAKNAAVVFSTLSAFKLDEIPKTIPGLEQDHLDVLMQYLFKGMSEPDEERCKALLTWHAAVVAAGGLGSIVRAMTSRGRV